MIRTLIQPILLAGALLSPVTIALAETRSSTPPNPYIHNLPDGGSLRFTLNEPIKHKHFWWPRTLLNYRVVFNSAKSSLDHYALTDAASGMPIPFQLSDIRNGPDHQSVAIVSFFSDLPSGGSHTYDFHPRAAGKTITPPVPTSVGIEESKEHIVLDTGVIKVRIPNNRTIAADGDTPGPIESVADASGWMGQSKIISPRKAPQAIHTEILDRGPLFARARVTYTFTGQASYAVTIKAPLGYDFVEVTEQIEGLDKEDHAGFDMEWTGAKFTHRRGNEPIDVPRPIMYRGEDPHFTGPARIENPAEEFYFRLGHVAADNTINVTAADFSNQNNDRAIGLAVLDGSKWDDREYAIWADNETLSIRFRYANGILHWFWPLASGSRSIALAAYGNKTAGRQYADSFDQWRNTSSAAAAANTGVEADKAWISFINSRYGGMSLDVIKDWQLTYPETARQPAPVQLPGHGKELEDVNTYLNALWNGSEPVKVEGNWVSPVSMRVMSGWVVPGYNKLRGRMSPEDRSRVTALLLFHAYFASREDVSAMRHVLRGHPNFMADWKYPLTAGSFLFPDHPMAREWADQFEKWLEIMGVFCVRPDVKTWEASGGRWTESIAVYNWAFIQPSVYANQLGMLYDGRDRWPNEGLALHGDYLAGIVTAPVIIGKDGIPLDIKPGTVLSRENGFQRIHPPQGAHSGRRPIPAVAEDFGLSLLRYRPLTGEHLLWASQRPAGPASGIEGQSISRPPQPNTGTNPRLASAKYTGYGIVMRAAVDTPDEISVYLQQIDKGPNYRWGFGNEGGCGDIYYYAGGKSYAGHLMEDAGDRRVTDTELTCNTGVYKDHTFRGIGMNELTEPFYNLETAQFAEILPRQGADAYSWPEYKSRSVMLVGSDYIITYDAADSMSRMSWNTIKGQDEMPAIIPLRGENAYHTTQTTVSGHMDTSESQRFEPYKGGGDRMALVTHRKDLTAKDRKDKTSGPVSEVKTPDGMDTILLQRDPFSVIKPDFSFSGRAGVIRKKKNGMTELSLFHGTTIGTDQLKLTTDNTELGISAIYIHPQEAHGRFFSRRGGKLTLESHANIGMSRFHIDGVPVRIASENQSLSVELPAGDHRWQLTAGPAEPMPPQVVRTEARADGAKIHISPVASAQSYRIERSADGGFTWQTAGTTRTPEFVLGGVKPTTKLHVRAIALNGNVTSRPGRDYPVYVTGKPVESPTGLKLSLAKDEVCASWGEVLGAKAYILCRREAGAVKWQEIYRGLRTSFQDHPPGVTPACTEPGLESAAMRPPLSHLPIYQYAVSAMDDVGESKPSPAADTNPASWLNWYPATPLVFKRRSAYWLPPYARPEEVPPAQYPE